MKTLNSISPSIPDRVEKGFCVFSGNFLPKFFLRFLSSHPSVFTDKLPHKLQPLRLSLFFLSYFLLSFFLLKGPSFFFICGFGDWKMGFYIWVQVWRFENKGFLGLVFWPWVWCLVVSVGIFWCGFGVCYGCVLCIGLMLVYACESLFMWWFCYGCVCLFNVMLVNSQKKW